MIIEERDLFIMVTIAVAGYLGWCLYSGSSSSSGSAKDEPQARMPVSSQHRPHSRQERGGVRGGWTRIGDHPRIDIRGDAVADLHPVKIERLTEPDEKPMFQTHPDYLEVLEILKNAASSEQLFNPAAIPVTNKGRADKRDVYEYANKFVYRLSTKSKVGLGMLDILRVYRWATEDQTRYEFDLVLQRDTPEPSKTKMILRVCMVLDYTQADDEKFFDDYLLSNKATPKLESAAVIGYTDDYLDVHSEAMLQYKAISNDADGEDFMQDSQIDSIVKRVRKMHADETRGVNGALDEDGENYATDVKTNNLWSRRRMLAGQPEDESDNEDGLDHRARAIGTRMVQARLKRNCQ
jgi:hypothetical protein